MMHRVSCLYESFFKALLAQPFIPLPYLLPALLPCLRLIKSLCVLLQNRPPKSHPYYTESPTHSTHQYKRPPGKDNERSFVSLKGAQNIPVRLHGFSVFTIPPLLCLFTKIVSLFSQNRSESNLFNALLALLYAVCFEHLNILVTALIPSLSM